MPPLDQLLATITGLATGASQPGMVNRMWQEVGPWVQRLVGEAGPKWIPRLSFGFQCVVPLVFEGRPVGPCKNNAIAACCVCNEPCCLMHSMVDCHGDAICYLCVNRSMAAAHGAAPPPEQPPAGAAAPAAEEVLRARRILDVKASTPWEEVRRAWRRRAAVYHPDNQKTGDAEKFRAVREAFEVLERDHEGRSAA